jgi:hypothetical protein
MKTDIIVTGGRDYDDWARLQDVLSVFNVGLIIQGGASGADRLAKKFAEEYLINNVTVEADWNKHGRAAGPRRNWEMLMEYPKAIVVAFPGGAGTANCVKQALQLNRIVLMVQK